MHTHLKVTPRQEPTFHSHLDILPRQVTFFKQISPEKLFRGLLKFEILGKNFGVRFLFFPLLIEGVGVLCVGKSLIDMGPPSCVSGVALFFSLLFSRLFLKGMSVDLRRLPFEERKKVLREKHPFIPSWE